MPDGDRLALLADARISADARILGLLIWDAQGEWIEVPYPLFRSMLQNGPSDDTIRRHLRALEGAGWIESKAGGRGHANQYRALLGADECGPKGMWRTVLAGTVENFRAVTRAPLNADRAAPHAALKPLVVGEEGSSTPSIVSPEAEQLIHEHDGQLEGCRGALRDYIASRVPPRRQKAYVATVLSWLNGLDTRIWRGPDGGKVPQSEWVGRIALGLNELGASDEADRKHPVGDPRNLLNKITGTIKDQHRSRANGHRDPPPKAGGRPQGGRSREGINARWGPRTSPGGDAERSDG